MAVRTDDVSDAYIIKRDIFHITYEKSSWYQRDEIY
jgi:hypothetical protein